MFKPITHKLNQNKINHSTIIRQIDSVDENVLNPLVNNHHEGIYGFESVNFVGDNEFYTVAPSDYVGVDGIEAILDYGMLSKSLNQLHCYSVELAYPSFLPIQINEIPLWHDLFKLNYPNVNIFTQFLIYKGQNNWKERFYDQYKSYLDGNDYPSSSKVGRSLQKKILTLIDKVSGSESNRKRVPQIERKLTDDGYRVSFRLMLHSENEDYVKVIENEIQDILSTRDYFNELVLIKYKNKEAYIEQYVNRMLSVKYTPVLSEMELFSLFMEVEVDDNTNINSTANNVSNVIDSRTFDGKVDQLPSATHILPEVANDTGIIYLKTILENETFKEYAKEHILPMCFGITSTGKLLLGSLAELKHILLAGSTGSGKSVAINQIVLTLLLHTQPHELMMYIVDPKIVEFVGFEGFPHIPDDGIVTDMNKVQGLLSKLIDEMEKRYEFLRDKRYKSMVKFNKDHPKQSKPYIVCVIDEFADLIMTNPEIEDYIQRLGQKARAAGIHLICATQRPEAKIISGAIKANLPSKIAFRCDSNIDYRTVFGKNQPFNLNGKGDGVARLEGNEEEFVRFQSPVITLDEGEEEDILDQLKELFNGKGTTETKQKVEDATKEAEEEPLDKLRRIISESGETRIRILQDKMGISTNKVHSMIKELVDEGFLVQDGRSYKVADSE